MLGGKIGGVLLVDEGFRVDMRLWEKPGAVIAVVGTRDEGETDHEFGIKTRILR